jgi:hypothetical protein
MTDIVAVTDEYEAWLRTRITVDEADLTAKHSELASTPLRFLRGTYYYWLTRMPVLAPTLTAAPAVPLVGDLHAENFGTWLDSHGVSRWGVNDLDELGRGPYPIDLVRLATSCVLSPHVAVDSADICDLLLEVWRTAAPGHAVKLDDAPHLAHVLPATATDRKYFQALAGGAQVDASAIPPQVTTATAASVDAPWQPSWHHRTAGTGSLGHPRYAAVDVAAAIAREVKLLGPPSAEWAHLANWHDDPALYDEVEHALHGPSPASRVSGWQLRRLAPDVVRIEISALNPHETERVLRSMAQSVADLHGVDAAALATARADEADRPKHWLRDAVTALTEDTTAAYHDWRER